jgi:hypothetical protein
MKRPFDVMKPTQILTGHGEGGKGRNEDRYGK